jgi:hypothetical protein
MGQEQTHARGNRSTRRLAECVLKLTEPVSSPRYESATRPLSIGIKPARVPPGKRDIAMNISNERLDSAARQPLPPIPETEAKNFSAAKDSADRSKEDNVPNGGPQFRGPLEGGATGGSPSPRADRQTGLDGGGAFFGGTWDFGSKGLQVGDLKGGATPHVVGRDDVTKAKIDSAIDKAKSDLDSMSEMGETESLRLQMAMDRMSKMMSTLSNLLKKESDTAEGITANLK